MNELTWKLPETGQEPEKPVQGRHPAKTIPDRPRSFVGCGGEQYPSNGTYENAGGYVTPRVIPDIEDQEAFDALLEGVSQELRGVMIKLYRQAQLGGRRYTLFE